MNRLAFKMKLFPGKADEYKRRHDDLWPELKMLLKLTGVRDYSIYLDEESGVLFGSLKIADKEAYEKLPDHPVMKRWWDYMKDLMDTNPDHSPVSVPLKEVFYLE